MKILSVHNSYQQAGGEDVVREQEAALLQAAGHQVISFERSNSEVKNWSLWQKAALPARFIWARDVHRELGELLRRERPDVAHFHNTHFMVSPSAYYACRDAGVPVVQTIHNYRLLCPAAQFRRAGLVCEDCLGKTVPWPGVLHGCYRGSRAETAMVATGIAFHRWIGTWAQLIHRYIAPTDFVRRKLLEGGIPADLVVVKPNSVYPDPGPGDGPTPGEDYLVFVGRLSPEKGIETMLAAWEGLNRGGTARALLRIIGDGPLAPRVIEAALAIPGIEWLGRQPKEVVLMLMKRALALIFPSTWYEAFPLVIAEAFAVGLPVIASDLGSMSALVQSGRTGLHFPAGNAEALTERMRWMITHPAERRELGRSARAVFDANYTAERNRDLLLAIYEQALRQH